MTVIPKINGVPRVSMIRRAGRRQAVPRSAVVWLDCARLRRGNRF